MHIRHSIRATRAFSKAYINHTLEEFAPKWIEKFNLNFPHKTIAAIEFGKQDSRGAPSITLIDSKYCATHQKHFSTNTEMMAFMEGFLAATHGVSPPQRRINQNRAHHHPTPKPTPDNPAHN